MGLLGGLFIAGLVFVMYLIYASCFVVYCLFRYVVNSVGAIDSLWWFV